MFWYLKEKLVYIDCNIGLELISSVFYEKVQDKFEMSLKVKTNNFVLSFDKILALILLILHE